MAVIKFQDLCTAYDIWCKHYGYDFMDGQSWHKGFGELTGLGTDYIRGWHDEKYQSVNVPERCERAVKMLLSPHYKALLKAQEVVSEKIISPEGDL